MARQVKVLATKAGPTWQERANSYKLTPDLHTCPVALTRMVHVHMPTHNK